MFFFAKGVPSLLSVLNCYDYCVVGEPFILLHVQIVYRRTRANHETLACLVFWIWICKDFGDSYSY